MLSLSTTHQLTATAYKSMKAIYRQRWRGLQSTPQSCTAHSFPTILILIQRETTFEMIHFPLNNYPFLNSKTNWKERNDRKTRKKAQAAILWLQGSYKVLVIEGGSTRWKSVENSLWNDYGSVARQSTWWRWTQAVVIKGQFGLHFRVLGYYARSHLKN